MDIPDRMRPRHKKGNMYVIVCGHPVAARRLSATRELPRLGPSLEPVGKNNWQPRPPAARSLAPCTMRTRIVLGENECPVTKSTLAPQRLQWHKAHCRRANALPLATGAEKKLTRMCTALRALFAK
ncbi:uncharacterized protein Tco025E_08597 [Trypanosoma conorhini]|uniref:Uncharacterized protein n=1 Tax=Trypanosoma conorhini TaxID=83891 RepID=A0A422N7G3_9TRYP|nr:uncharacterized protein Tco025E_08597 [Trypanosoma conorhini]RNF01385.1 hypothetical protein Tco025E_08597 [Trypanosoma conorhini]